MWHVIQFPLTSLVIVHSMFPARTKQRSFPVYIGVLALLHYSLLYCLPLQAFKAILPLRSMTPSHWHQQHLRPRGHHTDLYFFPQSPPFFNYHPEKNNGCWQGWQMLSTLSSLLPASRMNWTSCPKLIPHSTATRHCVIWQLRCERGTLPGPSLLNLVTKR